MGEPESPLQVRLLWHKAKRYILSSDEDESYGRMEEVCTPCKSAPLGSSGSSVPSPSSRQSGKSSQRQAKCKSSQHPSLPSVAEDKPDGSLPEAQSNIPFVTRRANAHRDPLNLEGEAGCSKTMPSVTVDPEEGVIITMAQDDEQIWNSAEDSDSSEVSSSSTPDFKRGKHSSVSLVQVMEALRADSKTKVHNKGRARGPSLQVLADARLSQWPRNDKICLVEYHQDWKFKQWLVALRAETVRITCNTVILYFEQTQEMGMEEVPRLKNALQAICRTIRQHKKDTRIFVANLLPQIGVSPLRRAIDSKFALLQAVRSVNRAIKKVHFLSVFEHFTSKKGKVIKPTHHYFQENNQLTQYGCLIFHECLMRESGIKGYWF